MAGAIDGIAAVESRALAELARGLGEPFCRAVDCLYHIVDTIHQHKAELVYTDEDLIGDDGRCLSIFRKPAFNSELLLSHNYINHFVAVTRELFDRVGGGGISLTARLHGFDARDEFINFIAGNGPWHK